VTRLALSLLAFFASVTFALAAETVAKVDDFGDWQLYADPNSPHLFCFVSSEPKSSDPSGTTRSSPRIYITAWPKDGVKAEISVRMGFPVKAGSEPSVKVGDAAFKLFSADDRIYVKDATQELKLVDAMKKGANLTAEATSERGKTISDSYSLTGLGQAMTKLQAECF
jgi:invasion protein IalB